MQFGNKFRKGLLTLWQSPPFPPPFSFSQPTFPAYSTASAAPLSSCLTVSHSLSLPIRLSVGGALEKVVHFWISGFFEVKPSLLLVCNLSFLSFISPLICVPLFLSLPLPPTCSTSLLTKLFFSAHPFPFFQPLCCLHYHFDPQDSTIFLHWLSGCSQWPDVTLTLEFIKVNIEAEAGYAPGLLKNYQSSNTCYKLVTGNKNAFSVVKVRKKHTLMCMWPKKNKYWHDVL